MAVAFQVPRIRAAAVVALLVEHNQVDSVDLVAGNEAKIQVASYQAEHSLFEEQLG